MSEEINVAKPRLKRRKNVGPSKTRAKMPSAVSIVARSLPDRIIGIENRLPWHLGTDLKHFKAVTQDHAIIMGRKTFESLGRPLPRRYNIVLSREKVQDTDSVKWAQDPETALLIADFYSISNDKKQFFVIGGERIYDLFGKWINKVFLTEVNSGPINGDAKFDFDFPEDEWYYLYRHSFSKSKIDDFDFVINCILRRKPVHRNRLIREFKGANPLFDEHWERYAASISKVDDEAAEKEQLDFIYSSDDSALRRS